MQIACHLEEAALLKSRFRTSLSLHFSLTKEFDPTGVLSISNPSFLILEVESVIWEPDTAKLT